MNSLALSLSRLEKKTSSAWRRRLSGDVEFCRCFCFYAFFDAIKLLYSVVLLYRICVCVCVYLNSTECAYYMYACVYAKRLLTGVCTHQNSFRIQQQIVEILLCKNACVLKSNGVCFMSVAVYGL